MILKDTSTGAHWIKQVYFSKDGVDWEWHLSTPLTNTKVTFCSEYQKYIRIDAVLFDFEDMRYIEKLELLNTYSGLFDRRYSKYILVDLVRKEIEFLESLYQLPCKGKDEGYVNSPRFSKRAKSK